MFATPTAFILGAGVSVPHGFPSGPGLIDAICKGSAGDVENFTKLLKQANRDQGRSESFITEFIDHLSRSELYSIDAWLEGNPEYMGVGKTAIAATIWQAEHRAVSKAVDDGDNWFRWLWSQLYTPNIKDLDKNDVHFLTFNYDRFLEYRLLTSIRHSYAQRSNAEHLEAFEVLLEKIHHIHGKLNTHSLESYGNLGNDVYEGAARITEAGLIPRREEFSVRIADLASTINIGSESARDQKLEQVSIEVLRQKKKLIFLGFSYDQRNVKRLQFQPIANSLAPAQGTAADIVSYQVVGSAYKLELAEQMAIKNQFSGRIHFGENTLNAVAFCKKYILVQR